MQHKAVYYSACSLYMFQLSTTPIIRSTQNCNYNLLYWSYFLCSYLHPTWPIDHDGGRVVDTWKMWSEL